MLHDGSRWLIIQKFDIHPSSCLQQIIIIKIHVHSKINGSWNIGHLELHLFWDQKFASNWLSIQKFDAHPSNSLQDIMETAPCETDPFKPPLI